MSSAQIDSGPRDCPCGRKETVWPGLHGPPTCVGCSLIHHRARWADRKEETLALVADEIAEGMPACYSIRGDSYPATVTEVKRDATTGMITAIRLRREGNRMYAQSLHPKEVMLFTLRSNGRYVRSGHAQQHGVMPHVGVREDERDPHV